MVNNTQYIWEKYKEHELEALTPILKKLGFALNKDQPHTSGERYLMHAVTTTSGRKLIILGYRIKDNLPVVIKATSDKYGRKELIREHMCTNVLHKINFAHDSFFSPNEILFTKKNNYTISILEFIEQKREFIKRPIKEQFTLALKSFKSQESAHATTYDHRRIVSKTFGQQNSIQYIEMFDEFIYNIIKKRIDDTRLHKILENAQHFLKENVATIEQYCGFLTHTDFVPHNFRVVNDVVYLLDNSSLRFGNKYEGWARFLNFMTLYNPELERAFVDYVRLNRTKEEVLSLKLMRIYRLGEIIWYYVNTLSKSSGNLYKLNNERIGLWSTILNNVMNDEIVSTKYLESYRIKRDLLRSHEEKLRQNNLH